MAKTATADPVPFLEQLRQRQSTRADDAQALIIRTAQLLADGKQPRDVDAVDEALHVLEQGPEFLQDLAGKYTDLRVAEHTASTHDSARDALAQARALEAAALAELDRERQRLQTVVVAAGESRGRAEKAFAAARDARATAVKLGREIVGLVRPEFVENTRTRIKEISQRMQVLSGRGADRELQELRQRLERLEAGLPGSADRGAAEAQIAKVAEAIAFVEARNGPTEFGRLSAERDELERSLLSL